MLDPISLAVGGALLAAGWVSGRLARRHAHKPDTPHPASCPCGPGHVASMHRGKDGRCLAEIRRPHYYPNGERSGWEWVPCPCREYMGPELLTGAWSAGVAVPPPEVSR